MRHLMTQVVHLTAHPTAAHPTAAHLTAAHPTAAHPTAVHPTAVHLMVVLQMVVAAIPPPAEAQQLAPWILKMEAIHTHPTWTTIVL